MSAWSSIDARVKASYRRTGEPLTITLANATLCTYGRVTSVEDSVEGEDAETLFAVLSLGLAWSDATLLDVDLKAGKTVTVQRDNESTRHEATSVRKLNDARGRVNLKAAA